MQGFAGIWSSTFSFETNIEDIKHAFILDDDHYYYCDNEYISDDSYCEDDDDDDDDDVMTMIYLSLSHGYGGDMAPGASSSTAKASPFAQHPLSPQDSVECHI